MFIEFDNLKDLLIFNIKYYRFYNNISQERLAELAGLSPRYITDIERGLHCPTINKLEDIARALNVEPYVLFKNNKRIKSVVVSMEKNRQYNQKEKIN